MRYIIILILFCSCSSTFKVNGHEIKRKTRPVPKNETPILVASFLLGYSIVNSIRP